MKRTALLCLAIALSVSAIDTLIRDVNLKEYWGFERNREFVSGGIPLPKGLIKDVKKIGLTDQNGTSVEYQSRPLMKWPDGSLRWLWLCFPGNAQPNKTTRYSLHMNRYNDAPAVSYADRVNVTEESGQIVVSTGTMKFYVNKANGNQLISKVIIAKDADGVVDDEIVSPGSSNGAFIYDHWNNEYSSIKDSAFKVKVEESGPLRAVIKITGYHSNGTNEKRFYGYLCRIYAYAGKSDIRMQYTVKNSFIHPRGALAFNGMSLKLKLNLQGSKNATWFDKTSGSSVLTDSAYVFQPYQFGYETKANGATLHAVDTSDKSARALGWMDISDGTWGAAVGIEEFASNCPNEVFSSSNGTLEARLWPSRYQQGSDSVNYARYQLAGTGETDRFYVGMGEHKTHTVCFYFHKGNAASASVNNVMASFNHPLIPEMDNEWISETRAVPGDLSASDSADVDPAHSAWQMPIVNRPLKDPAWKYNEEYYDSKVTFGEAFWRNDHGRTEIFENLGTRYLRRPDPKKYRMLKSNAWLEADMRRSHVDSVVCYDPKVSMHFWLIDTCKGRRDSVHSASLPNGPYNVGYTRSWYAPQPGVFQEHFTNRDLFIYYLVSGDYKIRDGLYEITDMNSGYRVWRDSRKPQSIMARGQASGWASLWMASMIEGRDDTINGITPQDYFLKQLHTWTQGSATQKGILSAIKDSTGIWGVLDTTGPHNFFEGLVDMSFGWYLDYFNHDSLKARINKRAAFWRDLVIGAKGGVQYHGWAPTGIIDNPLSTVGSTSSNYRLPSPLARLYFHSADTAFRRKMDLFLMDGKNNIVLSGGADHGFLDKDDLTLYQSYLFYLKHKSNFLKDPMIGWDTTSNNSEIISEKTSGIALTLFPNPFNPAVSIVSSLPDGVKGVLTVFSVDGKVVMSAPVNKCRTVTVWNGSSRSGGMTASGVYFAVLQTAAKTVRQKMILLQ
ncbi:MAG: T9SS type A sorting domain-containing protein [Fibrobacteres bacterium]|nr:T9SS type A sorting domain-containing protein [Fibrobacterota bacterium]